MPLTIVTNPKLFIDFNAKKRLEIVDKMIEAQRNVLLEAFDDAELDAEKQGCIDVCNMLGLSELSEQLTQELQLEKEILTLLN